MKTLKSISYVLLLSGAPVFSQTATTSSVLPKPTRVLANIDTVHTTKERDGQQVFDQNCSRCHTTPQGFSPRISGTVTRHMRVRANLSREDEQAILRFLNP